MVQFAGILNGQSLFQGHNTKEGQTYDEAQHTTRKMRWREPEGGIMHEWDVALTVGLFVVGGFMAIVGWLFKKRMEAYDKHLDECSKRAVVIGRMDERLCTVESQTKGINTTVHWVGDCMVTLGVKLDVDLPNRPQ